jgi:Tol biopolymer transport system component
MKKFGLHTLCWFILVGLFALPGAAQFYQGTNMEFGKNRVQYREFTWFYYPSENFEVYYYIGGEELAQYTLLSCERNLKEIERFFDYTIDEKIEVLSYLNQSEFRQSNLGLTGDDQYNIGGAAKIVGSKMFTYYEGDHTLLEKQIRENLARVVFAQLVYGGNWKEVLKNSTLLSVPKWFEEGIVAYAAGGVSAESSTFVKDMVRSNKFRSFNQFEGEDARLAGQTFWSFISEVYGQNVIPNILYMAQVSRNVESGFLYVLGLPLDELSREYIKFYKEKAAADRNEWLPSEVKLSVNPTRDETKAYRKAQKQLGEVKVKYRSKFEYSHFTRSPDGRHVAYVTHELGQYRIWLYDTETHRSTCILKREPRMDRIPDKSFPVLAWHPSSEMLTYVFEKRANAWIGNYSLKEKKHTQKELFLIEKINSMQYSADGKRMVMSALNRGQTDVYLYQVIGNNFEQLTRDKWDDLNPSFVDGGRSVIFTSNRTDDTLRTDDDLLEQMSSNHDVFLFNLENRSKLLERITSTRDADESNPYEYGSKYYTFLSDENGFRNRTIAYVDSAISTIDTAIHYRYFTVARRISSFQRDIHDYQFQSADGSYLLGFRKAGRPYIALGNRNNDVHDGAETKKQSGTESPAVGLTDRLRISADTLSKGDIDIDNYMFEDERLDYTLEKETVRVQESGKNAKALSSDTLVPFVLPRSRNYRLNFAADRAIAQMSNNFFNPIYQNYTGPSPSSISPGLSGFTQFGVSDLFEDYKIVGGFRANWGLDNAEYGISFERLQDRWDRKLIFSRQSQRVQRGVDIIKLQSNDVAYSLKYPFSEVSSIRIRGDFRIDRGVRQSNDLVSLEAANITETNLALKIEYVFDNTIPQGLNLFNGTRAKAWVERYQQPNIDKRTDINIVGFDMRHYQRIHRNFIAAFRIAGNSSFGAQKVINYFGGVDNWLFQRVDNATPINPDEPYRFQSFVGPVRGFWVNARNGNSAVVANTELRLPVFKYFAKNPIKSDFIENFQLVTFFDAGSAWTGWNPYSDKNLFNRTDVIQNPVTVSITNNREPVVYGYGFGIHSRLLGYFVRADWAWGVDDGRVLDRVFYLSLNMDF